MTLPLAIDVHSHFFPERFLRLIETEGASAGARLDRSNPRGVSIVVNGVATAPLGPAYWDLDLRRKAMDRTGVAVQALSLTQPMVYFARGDLGRRLAAAFNDALAEAHTAFPDRFVGCMTLPMQDPAAAVHELQRAARLPGIRAVYLGTNVNGRDLSDPAFAPVFERCEEFELPVLLHPLNVLGGERLRPYYLANLLGNPFDTAVAAAHLVFGGVLDRFPRLQVCLPHAGGALPYVAGRLQHGQRVRPEARDRARRPFTAYLRRFTYDTISHSPEALGWLIRTVGADRVMVGSDFCFDMGYERPRDIVTKRLRLRRADQVRILHDNAARLLGLG
ncbi:MAG TPA: amidohydrolase family protein [Calidithermus sp.]|nr:amidohydrolase family protein [Calidithermus sp.]